MFKKAALVSVLLLTLLTYPVLATEASLPKHLQDISVTIRAGRSEGSGVLVTRMQDGKPVSFVWTAGHVVSSLRKVRTVITNRGIVRKVVVFEDAFVIRELTENGRRVGEIKVDAKVIKYSNSVTGEDLALLMIRHRGIKRASCSFYLEDKLVPIGTPLYHVGSLRGQLGANSMTTGIMSQIGRTYLGTVYDQTTVTAFPGSSGGGVFLTERSNNKQGKYVGMIVRGSGETFNLMVPVRRMKDWAKRAGVLFAMDPSVPVPTMRNLRSIPIESLGEPGEDSEKEGNDDEEGYRFLIRKIEDKD